MRPYAVLAALGAACSTPQPAAPAFVATVEGGLPVRHAEAPGFVAEPAGVAEPINVYFGKLHAHSKLSDGNPFNFHVLRGTAGHEDVCTLLELGPGTTRGSKRGPS